MKQSIQWNFEVDVAIVGYGGAGAITAITAHDLGVQTLIMEKQGSDTPTAINHTPSTRMSGGFFLCATDAKEASDYLYWSSWGSTPKECCDVMGRYMTENEDYIRSLGGSVSPAEGRHAISEYRDIAPGGKALYVVLHKGAGPGHFAVLMENVQRRNIPVLYNHRGRELLRNEKTGDIIGVLADYGGEEIYVKAKRAVVLSTGGFEWDEEMKLNYLRVSPTYFYCNPGSTGDGIKMGQKVGAALWHMNALSARIIPYIEGVTPAFGANYHTPFILVDKYGKRFTTEPGDRDPTKYRSHGFWLECMVFDTHKADYPRIPCYQIFDETARVKGPCAKAVKKGLLANGSIEYFHRWSHDNSEEIAKGWIFEGSSIETLAECIANQDTENGSRMNASFLADTLGRFNRYCIAGRDEEFNRSADGLVPLKSPPYYALKLYPGGPNTNGGLRKNAKGQVLDPEGQPIPRLYAPGENGSYFGFLYSGGGNICENIVWGRVTGEHAAREVPWDSPERSKGHV